MPFGNYTSYPLPVEHKLISMARQSNKMKQRGKGKSRRRGYRKRRPVPAREQARLAKLNTRVNKLSRSLKSDQATHTLRSNEVDSVGASARQCNNNTFFQWDVTNVEASMAALRYYDPSLPGTLVTANAATGTYTRQVHFSQLYESVCVRNNYQVPAYVTLYLCTSKVDTDNSPTAFYSSGLADQYSGTSPGTSSVLIHMSDIKQVTDNWTLKRMKHKLLEPGQQFSCFSAFRAFDYDPSNVDSHNLAYQKKYRGHCWVVRVEGAIAHDTVAAQYLKQQAQVDIYSQRTVKITYDAGVNLTDISVLDNQTSAFSNSGVVSNKPVSDNQAFSIA